MASEQEFDPSAIQISQSEENSNSSSLITLPSTAICGDWILALSLCSKLETRLQALWFDSASVLAPSFGSGEKPPHFVSGIQRRPLRSWLYPDTLSHRPRATPSIWFDWSPDWPVRPGSCFCPEWEVHPDYCCSWRWLAHLGKALQSSLQLGQSLHSSLIWATWTASACPWLSWWLLASNPSLL